MFRIVSLGALALVVALLGVTSAGAHQACISVPDRATACNRDAVSGNPAHQDHYVDACDRNSDGLRTRAWYRINGAVEDFPTQWDPNGANPGCASDRTYIFYLLRHRSCVEVVGCSAWENH
jgi:hypothetical protein